MQLDSLREQYETGQEGWRAAMAERAKQEVEQRVAAIKDKLTQERNEEIEVRSWAASFSPMHDSTRGINAVQRRISTAWSFRFLPCVPPVPV